MSPAANVIFLNHVVSEQHLQMAIGTTNHILHNSALKDQCVWENICILSSANRLMISREVIAAFALKCRKLFKVVVY